VAKSATSARTIALNLILPPQKIVRRQIPAANTVLEAVTVRDSPVSTPESRGVKPKGASKEQKSGVNPTGWIRVTI
jgi:hypothetical protein